MTQEGIKIQINKCILSLALVVSCYWSTGWVLLQLCQLETRFQDAVLIWVLRKTVTKPFLGLLTVQVCMCVRATVQLQFCLAPEGEVPP